MRIKLEEAVQMAAGHLPVGWQINLSVERGAGWVDLFDEDGEKVEFDTSPDNDLSQQIDDAVDHALKRCGLVPASSVGEIDG
jgi:hypothetical protein